MQYFPGFFDSLDAEGCYLWIAEGCYLWIAKAARRRRGKGLRSGGGLRNRDAACQCHMLLASAVCSWLLWLACYVRPTLSLLYVLR